MQTSNEDFDKEEAERNAKQIIFNEEVKRLRVLFEEGAREQKEILGENERIKKEWVNESSRKVKDWPEYLIESYTLEQLKRYDAEFKEKAEEEDDKAKFIVILTLVFILVAVIAYTSKAYLLLFITLSGLLLFWAIMSPPQKPNPDIICPHCRTKGQVFTNLVTVKKGIDGGKATGAILTGGLSLIATGLSREEKQTKAHCGKCGSVWHF